MASAQVVETSVTNNSPSQDSYHPDDLFQSRYATPGFKPFSYCRFYWSELHFSSLRNILRNNMCCEAPVLAYYDVRKEVTIQYASKSAVGAVLLQEGRPIAYASRKLRQSEINWAPIEKEMQANVFSTQKFREYIMGKTTMVQTDHKPLETILRKPMTAAPLRLQAMILKVSGYDFKVEYLPGKKQILADTLSRTSLNE